MQSRKFRRTDGAYQHLHRVLRAFPGGRTPDGEGSSERIADFEPEAFGISTREAAVIDPQQRLLLEVVWEALEDAGIPLNDLSGSHTGILVGISTFDYSQLQSSPVSHTARNAD